MNNNNDKLKYTISLKFEEIKLPPFQDILIVGSRCPQGKFALNKCFDLLSCKDLISIDINNENVESIIISKKLLLKISQDKIINILEEKVFPFISECELSKVDLDIKISYDPFELEG